MQIFCRITGHAPGKFHYVTGDTHIYGNHTEAVKEQLARMPYENRVELKIAEHLVSLEDFERATPDDFELVNYISHGKLQNETVMVI
jgi:thymidylate synthase